MMHPIAIIQARMGSTRLPGKVLLEASGHPLLWHLVRRLKEARTIQDVIIATTLDEEDAIIRRKAEEWGIKTYAGSRNDLLDRYYRAAERFEADPIVRITADCPLIDPGVVDRVVGKFIELKDCDLVYADGTFPDGLDVGVFSFRAIRKAWDEARLPSEREHVGPYILNHPELFKIGTVSHTENLSHMRWTVDEERDYRFVQEIMKRLYRQDAPVFSMDDVLRVLEKEPGLSSINSGIVRNAGYLKSLREDGPIKEDVMQPMQRKLSNSEALWERAKKVIPRGTQTLSKGPDQFVDGVAPKYLQRGAGCHVWDVDGNEYIDYPLALGPILLGYNYPAVTQAVYDQIREGTTFTLMHPKEVELAELLTEIIPCAEMVRFGKNGADATMAAIRIARAHTGRDHVAYCGYHGCHDWYASTTSLNKGIPEFNKLLMHQFEYNRPDTLEAVFKEHPDRIAAVILEQPAEEPQENFLQQVLEIAHRNGSLFVMDEICTGFRYALGGAQEYYGVVPDLACFGKGMANGFPISVILGKKEFMKELDEIFFSMTFSGDTTSIAAALATIREVREKKVIPHIWRIGGQLRDGLNRIIKSLDLPVEVPGNPVRSGFVFRDGDGRESLELKSLFLQETVKRGILFGGPVYISFSHTEKEVQKTLEASHDAFCVLKKAVQEGNIDRYMEGRKIGTVYRERR